MSKQKKIKLGTKHKPTLKKRINNNFPLIWQFLINTKWGLRHNIPLLNTKLTKQVRRFSSEISKIEISDKKNSDAKSILFFAMRQDPPHLGWGTTLEMALKLRGHNVTKIACDGFIKHSCNSAHYPDIERKSCASCRMYSQRFHKMSPTLTDWLSNFSTQDDWKRAEKVLSKVDPKDYETFTYEGIPIGELAKSSTVHFLREGEISKKEEHRKVYKDFIIGGIAMIDVCEQIINKHKPEIVVMLNGWFISERVMLEIAKRNNIRVVTYENGFRTNTLFFSEGKPVEYEINELWDKYKDTPLENNERKEIDSYLNTREKGDLGWVNFDMDNAEEKDLRDYLKIESSQKVAVAFSSISWDSTLWGLDVGFKNLEDWLYRTIQYFIDNQDIQLVVRLHPGEIVESVASHDSIEEKINKIFSHLPKNIKIIPPTSKISSYSLMDIADVGLVYTSTTGLEMAIKGIPVIVAGLPHYRNKGFTFDPSTQIEYYELIQKLTKNNELWYDKSNYQNSAKRYAYRLFFDGCIAFKPIKENATNRLDEKVSFNFSSVSDLIEGKDKNVDEACERIVNGVYKSI